MQLGRRDQVLPVLVIWPSHHVRPLVAHRISGHPMTGMICFADAHMVGDQRA